MQRMRVDLPGPGRAAGNNMFAPQASCAATSLRIPRRYGQQIVAGRRRTRCGAETLAEPFRAGRNLGPRRRNRLEKSERGDECLSTTGRMLQGRRLFANAWDLFAMPRDCSRGAGRRRSQAARCGAICPHGRITDICARRVDGRKVPCKYRSSEKLQTGEPPARRSLPSQDGRMDDNNRPLHSARPLLK